MKYVSKHAAKKGNFKNFAAVRNRLQLNVNKRNSNFHFFFSKTKKCTIRINFFSVGGLHMKEPKQKQHFDKIN